MSRLPPPRGVRRNLTMLKFSMSRATPKGLAADVRAMVHDEMVAATAVLFPQVPIEVEAGVCDRWGQK